MSSSKIVAFANKLDLRAHIIYTWLSKADSDTYLPTYVRTYLLTGQVLKQATAKNHMNIA